MKAIAIIPARGGSKRIPQKNIKEFCGQPIIKYSIDAAIKSGVFDDVMVSTDDREIAEISQKYGAVIPFFRSQETSNDHATVIDAVKEVLHKYRDLNMNYDYFCLIYPTVPFINHVRLAEAMHKLYESDQNFLLPVVQYSYPPQRSRKIENGLLKWNYPENSLVRSQDLEPWYHDAGQYLAGKVNAFLKNDDYSKRTYIPLILSEQEVQDIDTQDDWDIAEIKYKIMNSI